MIFEDCVDSNVLFCKGLGWAWAGLVLQDVSSTCTICIRPDWLYRAFLKACAADNLCVDTHLGTVAGETAGFLTNFCIGEPLSALEMENYRP